MYIPTTIFAQNIIPVRNLNSNFDSYTYKNKIDIHGGMIYGMIWRNTKKKTDIYLIHKIDAKSSAHFFNIYLITLK